MYLLLYWQWRKVAALKYLKIQLSFNTCLILYTKLFMKSYYVKIRIKLQLWILTDDPIILKVCSIHETTYFVCIHSMRLLLLRICVRVILGPKKNEIQFMVARYNSVFYISIKLYPPPFPPPI